MSWTHSLQFLHDILVAKQPDAILNLDDDQLFTNAGLVELSGHLQQFEADRYEYRSLFLWDDPERYNERFPEHWSGNLFRVYPGDRFATHFVAHCPEACARSSSAVRLKCPVLNFGYINPHDRVDYWFKYKRAGKVDAHTLALIREPTLKDIEWQSPAATPWGWKQLAQSIRDRLSEKSSE